MRVGSVAVVTREEQVVSRVPELCGPRLFVRVCVLPLVSRQRSKAFGSEYELNSQIFSYFVGNGAVLSAMFDVISRKRLGITGPSLSELRGALHNADSLETKCQHLNLTLFVFQKLIPQALATIQSRQTPPKGIERKTSRHAPFSLAQHLQAVSKTRRPKCYERVVKF